MSGKKRKNNTPKKSNKASEDAILNDAVTKEGQQAATGDEQATEGGAVDTNVLINDQPDVYKESSLDKLALDAEPSVVDDGLADNLPDPEPSHLSDPEPSYIDAGDAHSGGVSDTEQASISLGSEATTEPVPTETIESKSHASELGPVADAAQVPPVANDPIKGSSGIVKKLGLLLLLLFILAVALGGYFVWQQLQSGQDGQSRAITAVGELDTTISERLAEQQKTIEALSAQALASNSAVDDMRLLVEQTTGQQDWIKQRLENHTNRLRSLAGTSREDWLLAEARYLLRLANQRLLTERGTTSAQALLQNVDKMLLDLDDADLFTVRQAIQNDIASLKLAPNVDREGIYLRIGALAKQVRTIPSAPISEKQLSGEILPDEPAQSEDAPSEAESSSWYSPITGSLSTAWSAVANSVEIRHYDSPPALFITEQEEASVRHNLHLLLTQAQLSLLREEPEIYKASLTNAVQWVDQYFGHYDKKSVLVEELASLLAMPVAEQSPDISSSLKVLTDYIERYHKLTSEKNPVTEAKANNKTEENTSEESSP